MLPGGGPPLYRGLSARGARPPRGTALLREQPADVPECLELERVAAGIEQEHRRLLADLALEADMRLDDETRPGSLQLVREQGPFGAR